MRRNEPWLWKVCPWLGVDAGVEKVEWLDSKQIGKRFYAFQREVSFAALHATHICAVKSKFVRHLLLAQSASFPEALEVLPQYDLQFSFHITIVVLCYF